MHCPFCRHTDSRVMDSRTTDDGSSIRRRRQCPECGHQFGSTDPSHLDRPVDAPVLSSQRERVIHEFTVRDVAYSVHRKPGLAEATCSPGGRRLRTKECSGGTDIPVPECVPSAEALIARLPI